MNFSKHLKKEREREKRGGVHQTNTNYHLLEVLVPTKHQTNTCIWLQSVSFGVRLLQTNKKPPSKHDHNNVVIISKKGEEGIRSRAQEIGRGSQEGQWRNYC
jgi:hypothetical protein